MKRRPFLKVLLVLLILGIGAYLYFVWQLGPYGEGGVVFLPKGSSVAQISKTLEDKDLIRSARIFRALVRWKGAGGRLQAGEYEITPGMAPGRIIDKIARGERIVHKLVIPEGFTFQQIALAIQNAGIAKAPEVLQRFRDPQLLAKLGFPSDSLEGYLFPATYEYDPATKVPDLLAKMIDTFKKNVDGQIKERAAQAGWTIPQLVTLASIIEKETGRAAERPLISSVFHNRLQIGMPLQSDPTVIYGLKNFDGNIRKADLSNPHPYNTYVHVGLPPGPIASPGKASLNAALSPTSTTYLFFVSKGDGSHAFSSSLGEHNALVARYQLGKTNPSPTPMPQGQVEKPTPAPDAHPGSAPAVFDRPVMKPVPWPAGR